MKKIIITILMLLLATNANEFKLNKINTVSSDTEFRNRSTLVYEQENVIAIIKKFDKLIYEINGYEEKEVLIKIRNVFENKYLINNADIIEIHKELNKKLEKSKIIY